VLSAASNVPGKVPRVAAGPTSLTTIPMGQAAKGAAAGTDVPMSGVGVQAICSVRGGTQLLRVVVVTRISSHQL